MTCFDAATSPDGRIAGRCDDLAFLNTLEGTFADSDYAMGRIITGFDSLIMGVTTFRDVWSQIAGGLPTPGPMAGRRPGS